MKNIPKLLLLLCLLTLPAHAQLDSPLVAKPALAAPQVTTHSATLTWNAVTQCGFDISGVVPQTCTGYSVLRGLTPGGETPIAPVSVPTTSFTDTNVVAGTTYYYVVKTINSYSVTSGPSNEVSAVIPGGTTPPPTGTFFPSTAMPAANSSDNIATLGVKLSGKVPWVINAVRYWKATNSNTTQNPAWTIWSASGQLLASGNFMNETTSGWQTAALTSPLSVAASTTVVIAVTTKNYGDTLNYFTTSKTDITNTLVAPVNAGVYAYGAAPVFPNQSWSSSNYWRDVVFSINVVVQPPPPLAWHCSGATCTASGGTSGQSVPTQLNQPNGPTGTVTLP